MFPEIFFELHRGLPREGPGSDEATTRALDLLGDLPRRPRVLDIGCGPGMPTLTLARRTGGKVIGLDLHRPYLEDLRRRAAASPGAAVSAVRASMTALPFREGAFDVVWSEGAAYIMGFDEALRAWKRLLVPRGGLALTEACWLRGSPPAELRAFWDEAYPQMRDIRGNAAAVQAAGYSLLGHFALPESCWWDDYYRPQEARIAELRERHRHDEAALRWLDEEEREIDIFRRFAGWYGYVFFVMRHTAA